MRSRRQLRVRVKIRNDGRHSPSRHEAMRSGRTTLPILVDSRARSVVARRAKAVALPGDRSYRTSPRDRPTDSLLRFAHSSTQGPPWPSSASGRKRQRARERNSASHEPFADGASGRFGSAIASRDAGLRHGPTHRRSRVRSRIACQAGTSVTLRLRHTPSGTRTWGPRYRSSEVRDASKPDRDADFPGRVVVEQNEVRRPRRRIRLAVEP
jgi:hypothetical protein